MLIILAAQMNVTLGSVGAILRQKNCFELQKRPMRSRAQQESRRSFVKAAAFVFIAAKDEKF